MVRQAKAGTKLLVGLMRHKNGLKHPTRLAAIRFLIFRFRPNVWWFGLILLARGPLLSLPGVIATNMPSLRLTLMLGILLASGGLQLWFLPWKAPILNLVDATRREPVASRYRG